jgi:hypothetical protein
MYIFGLECLAMDVLVRMLALLVGAYEFIIERPFFQCCTCHCRVDVRFRTCMLCKERLKHKVRIRALLACFYEVTVLRFDSTDTCTTTN